MEIPTEETIKKIQASINFDTKLTVGNRHEAIRTIKAQALEIRELQATICRLKDEHHTTKYKLDEAEIVIDKYHRHDPFDLIKYAKKIEKNT